MGLTFADLYARVGDYLGVSDTPTSTELARAKRIVNDGIRYFLQSYNWSFRKVTASGTLTAASSAFTLPSAFGTLVDQITYDDANLGPQPVFTSDVRVRRALATYVSQGRPRLYALHSTSTTGPEAYALRFWPVPDQAYVFTYGYRGMVADLTNDASVPLGANQHSETILEACLMIAELRTDDGGGGIHAAAFKERLAISIATDQQLAPDTLGGYMDAAYGDGNWNPGDRVTSYGGESIE